MVSLSKMCNSFLYVFTIDAVKIKPFFTNRTDYFSVVFCTEILHLIFPMMSDNRPDQAKGQPRHSPETAKGQSRDGQETARRQLPRDCHETAKRQPTETRKTTRDPDHGAPISLRSRCSFLSSVSSLVSSKCDGETRD